MSAKRPWAVLLLLAVLLLSVAGCSSPYRGRFEYDASLVSEVSFVWVEPDGTVTKLEELGSEQYPAFFQSLSQMRRHEYWNDPIDYIQGSAVLITFQNGDYHLMNHCCTIRCIDGKAEDTREYYGNDDFLAVWQQYCSQDYILP